MVCSGRDFRVFFIITSHVEELLNAVHLRGDIMPSRWDQIHLRGMRNAKAYYVSGLYKEAPGFVRLMLIRSECDATIQRDRGSAA